MCHEEMEVPQGQVFGRNKKRATDQERHVCGGEVCFSVALCRRAPILGGLCCCSSERGYVHECIGMFYLLLKNTFVFGTSKPLIEARSQY